MPQKKVRIIGVPQYQDGGKTPPPLYVDSKNDPRYKKYQDSLNEYNLSQRLYNDKTYSKKLYEETQELIQKGLSQKGDTPVEYKNSPNSNLSIPMYKRPVQSVKVGQPLQRLPQQGQQPLSPEQMQQVQVPPMPNIQNREWYSNNQRVPIDAEGEQLDALYNEDGTRKYAFGGPHTQTPIEKFNTDKVGYMNYIQDSLNQEVGKKIPIKEYNKQDAIRLKTGNFRGANVDTHLIDDLYSAAKRKGVDPYTMYGVAGQESVMGGVGTQGTTDQGVISGWNVAEKNRPITPEMYIANKGVPIVRVDRSAHGIQGVYNNEQQANTYLNQHPEIINGYRASQSKKLPQEQTTYMDKAAEFIKKGGVGRYNPGDPGYPDKVNKRIQELKNDPAFTGYLQKKGYIEPEVAVNQYGGPTMNKKIRITGVPSQMEYGGKLDGTGMNINGGYSNQNIDTLWRPYQSGSPYAYAPDPYQTKKTIPKTKEMDHRQGETYEVDEDYANHLQSLGYEFKIVG